MLLGQAHPQQKGGDRRKRVYTEEQIRAHRKKTRELDKNNRKRKTATNKAWREANPEKYYIYKRRCWIKRHYGITIEQYEELLTKQDNKCLICESGIILGKRKGQKNAALDHDHKSGKLRGFLCNTCNAGLGAFQDSPIIMENA